MLPHNSRLDLQPYTLPVALVGRGICLTKPKIITIAGPNGAGKTTFAREFLPLEAACPVFVNADLIAAGLSPFAPETAAIQAGRLMLQAIDHHAAKRESFAFETTLSGLTYARKIPLWRAAGYQVELFFLSLPSADSAVRRVAERVSQGGHDIPEVTIRRRFDAGLRLFGTIYQPLVDQWTLFDNSGDKPSLLSRSGSIMKQPNTPLNEPQAAYDGLPANASPNLRGAMRALYRAAERARRVAEQTGTDLIICRDGQIVRVKPEKAAV